jgi:hypothetical protein
VLWIQAVYYFVTGMWGLIDIKSFMKVTGPKTDLWLVKTVALLLITASFSFAVALATNTSDWPVAVLAVCYSASLAYIDFYYAAKKIISPVYLLDGIIESLFLLVWIIIIA